MTMALEGVKVVELARYISGPYCGMLLADLGADVVKVETPAGDPTRDEGPWIGDESLYFAQMNRNKRGVTIDLRCDDGRAQLTELLREADILIENFRPGVIDAMGYGREALAALNPRCITVSVSGLRAGVRDARPHGLRLHPPVPHGARRDQRATPRTSRCSPGAYIVDTVAALIGDDRRARGAAAAGADRRRPARRRRDARQRADAARPGRPGRRRDRRGAGAGRQCGPHVGAGRRLPRARRLGLHPRRPGRVLLADRAARWAGRSCSRTTALVDIVSRVAHRAEVDAVVGGWVAAADGGGGRGGARGRGRAGLARQLGRPGGARRRARDREPAGRGRRRDRAPRSRRCGRRCG